MPVSFHSWVAGCTNRCRREQGFPTVVCCALEEETTWLPNTKISSHCLSMARSVRRSYLRMGVMTTGDPWRSTMIQWGKQAHGSPREESSVACTSILSFSLGTTGCPQSLHVLSQGLEPQVPRKLWHLLCVEVSSSVSQLESGTNDPSLSRKDRDGRKGWLSSVGRRFLGKHGTSRPQPPQGPQPHLTCASNTKRCHARVSRTHCQS